jgi:hypothetical protein
MSTKTTLAFAVAAGFIGGIASQHLTPAPVWAQDQGVVQQEIRAHKFVLVDETGEDRGVIGFAEFKGIAHPTIQMMEDADGRMWTMPRRWWPSHLLPDATCTACPRKSK